MQGIQWVMQVDSQNQGVPSGTAVAEHFAPAT